MADQQKAMALPLYGNPDVRTPALDALAERGTWARHCFAAQPFCFPSRCSLMTGRYAHAHGVRGNGRTLVEDEVPLASMLREAGYRTGAVGHFHGGRAGGGRGFDVRHDMGQGRQREAWRRHHELANAAGRKTAQMTATTPGGVGEYVDGVMTDDAMAFLKETPDEQPFFLHVAWIAPHPPYFAPEPYASMYDPERLQYPEQNPPDAGKPTAHAQTARDMGSLEAPEVERRRALAHYYGMCTLVDDQVGRLLGALEARGQLENTIVIYTADHGDYAGEHGMWGKSCTLYDCLVRVPLLMAGPGIPEGRCAEGMVQTVDVVPTLLGLLEMETPPNVHGLELQRVWAAGGAGSGAARAAGGGGRTGFDIAFAEVGAFPARMVRDRERGDNVPFGPPASGRQEELSVMARTADWKLVYTPGREGQELYDLRSDPGELRNAFGRAGTEGVVAELRGRLLDWMLAQV